MSRLAVGMMSVAIGLGSLNLAAAQSESSSAITQSWNWLSTKKTVPPSIPPKPSADHTPVGTGASADKVHYLRQTSCNIPFAIDQSKNSPTELQLYVSQDRGTNWKFYAKAQPTAGHFAFRAITDGEYWFALRTVEKGAAPVDTRKLKPGLKVVFDTQQPDLRLEAKVDESGEVVATWRANDGSLDPGTLKIEYQTDPRSPWQRIMVPASQSNPAGGISGNSSWNPEPTDSGILVRAEICDRAGNKTVASRRLTGSTATATDGFRSRDDGSPATYPVAHQGQSWPVDNQLPKARPRTPVQTVGDLPPPKPGANPNSKPPVNGNLREASTTGDSTPDRRPMVRGGNESHPLSSNETVFPQVPSPVQPPVANRAPELNGSAPVEEEIAPLSGPAMIPNATLGADRTTQPPMPTAQPPMPAAQPPLPTAQPAVAPPPTATPVSQTPAANGTAVSTIDPGNLPNGERPRMTNVRQFSLDYEVDSQGPAGVARVELWGTSDGGRTWSHWQDDADRTSPFDLTVDRDGIYGFRIVIVGGNQLASARPQPGDPADLWVGIDTSLPTVRLTSAIYGEGEHVGQLDLRWQAVDLWFGDRPITLLFSETPQGPWTTIAAGLPNTGQYFWQVEPRIPRHIYLRIEARDEAGNVAEHQITDPISTAGLVPQGRIRGLRPNHTPAPNDRSARATRS